MCAAWQVAHGEVMKSIDRAIRRVEEKINQSDYESASDLQANLKFVLAIFEAVFFVKS